VVEQKEPASKKREHEGLYDKITAYGTIASVLLAIVGLFVSIGVGAIAYFTLAYTAHWPPFSPAPSASPRSAPTPAPSQATASSLPSAGGVPASYQGSWQGEIDSQAGPFEASMSLYQGTDGSQVGYFQNDTYDCRGTIYLDNGGGPLSLRIVTTSDPAGDCVSVAYAQVTTTSGGLFFSFDTTGGVPPGSGTLSPAS
jgi:hypothetical protein